MSNTNEENAADDICAICLNCKNGFGEIKELDCKHTFHEECIDEWLKIKPDCPLCRSIVIVHVQNTEATLAYEESTNQLTVNSHVMTIRLLKQFRTEQIFLILKNVCCFYPVIGMMMATVLTAKPTDINIFEKILFMIIICLLLVMAVRDLYLHIKYLLKIRSRIRELIAVITRV